MASFQVWRSFFCSLALVFIFCAHGSQAQAQETSKRGELLAIGDAAVVKGNSAVAKKAAITQALTKGVEDYIIHFLGNKRSMTHFERITQDILPAAREEITNFHILAEHHADGRYKVLLSLRVNEEAIQERLQSAGILLTETHPPTILFLVSESRDGNTTYWWKSTEENHSLDPVELELHKVFQDKGFDPINRTRNLPTTNRIDGLTSPDLQNNAIQKWGRLFSADVVIFGECHINVGERISLTLKALDVSRGVQICQESVAEPMAEALKNRDSLMAALKSVANRAAGALCPCIKGGLTSDGGKTIPLTLTLTGMRMPKEFWRFSDFLKEKVTGVTSVTPSRIQGNTMSANVEFQGDRDMFIKQILNHPHRPFPLRLDQIDQEALVFNLD